MNYHLKPLLALIVFVSFIKYASPAQIEERVTPEKVPFCTLALNSETHDGDLVLTEAVTYTSSHTSVLIDPLCVDKRREDGKLLSAQPTFIPTYKLDNELTRQYMKALAEDGSARIIFVGRVESKHQQYGPMGLAFQIDMQRLIAVHRITPAEREALGLPSGARNFTKSPIPPPP